MCYFKCNKVIKKQKKLLKNESGQSIPNIQLVNLLICIVDTNPAGMDASQMHLRDVSKRADLQISKTSPVRCIKDVSSETSLRSLRSSQRRL